MTDSAIYIAATGQNVGKTTLCLGILAALKKKLQKIGFIKPLGQRHVKIGDQLSVDKDVLLFKEHFQLPYQYEHMSPVILPAGFTKRFLDGKYSTKSLSEKIQRGFDHIASQSNYTIVEGTGHVGVGSIVGLSNAQVASLLGLDMVIIASGGLGSAFDELAQNISMCKQYGVNVRGVILNRVHDDKRAMLLDYFPKALKKWNIPLIGCIPFNDLLSKPCVQDFEALLNTQLIAGNKHRCRHFTDNRLVADSVDSFRRESQPNQLVITPACREDIINAFIDKHTNSSFDYGGGMILTGKNPPSFEVTQKIKQIDLPVLYAPLCSYDVMKQITTFIAKICMEDTSKVERAISLAEEFIDFDQLCRNPKVKI